MGSNFLYDLVLKDDVRQFSRYSLEKNFAEIDFNIFLWIQLVQIFQELFPETFTEKSFDFIFLEIN